MNTAVTKYMQNKSRADTANELNESTQSTYKNDLVYLFFKLLLFVILGGIFYYLMKDQNPTEVIQQIKETTQVAAKVVTEKVTDTAKSLKESIKENVIKN